ncbi:hypothetical protein BS50DRAFT_591954 [Corynespora cassiicola Philippines]|uniref:Uncharacterized protein n=1 Tax=Corynespora cassiicola Philippines TaxID=1448308 RepID=A0A2T2NBC7_CORCC|nr:hypothetical protein BS50DRAFT_591954 [Corynespora cassiicola Philippines]
MGRLDLRVALPPDDLVQLQVWIEGIGETSESKAVKMVQGLPIRRDLILIDRSELSFERVTSKVGALAQRRGQLAVTPCTNCKLRDRPFDQCILLDGYLGGGCASCYTSRPSERKAEAAGSTKRVKSSRTTFTPLTPPEGTDQAFDATAMMIPKALASTPNELVVMGDLVLPDPTSCEMDSDSVHHIKSIIPHLHDLGRRNLHFLSQRINISTRFSEFQNEERLAWQISGCEPELGSTLVCPSGSLDSAIAHHLHQPSFSTRFRSTGHTADSSNGCISMVMGGAYRKNHTLIYDHLHRRSARSEGLEEYPSAVLRAHETFTFDIMKSSAAKVEIVYGLHVQKRLLDPKRLKTTILPLWGAFAGIFLVLVHESNFANAEDDHLYRKVLLLATHPQRMFYEARGSDTARRQDLILQAATLMADPTIQFDHDYYTAKKWMSKTPTANELGRMRATELSHCLSIQEPFEAITKDQQSPMAEEGHGNQLWEQHFSETPHSNDTLRELLPPAIAEARKADSPDWKDPTQFPSAVLKWYRGQKQILFYEATVKSCVDISNAFHRCDKSLVKSNSITSTRQAMLNLMIIQEKNLKTLPGKFQDLYHSRFDGSSITTSCICGLTKRVDKDPRFSCLRVGFYIARQTKACRSAQCNPDSRALGTTRSLLPESDISWIHQSCIATRNEGLKRVDLDRVVQKIPANGTSSLVCWCVWCKEKTETNGGSTFFTDENPEWTLGYTRPLYIERRPKCLRCARDNRRQGRFIPVDPLVPSISRSRLIQFERTYGHHDSRILALLLDEWLPSSRVPRTTEEDM